MAEGFLAGVRVLEVADEHGEYLGKLLAGLGADVVKIEPPGGEATRGYGPFVDDVPDPERSLYFWHYNLGKRGVQIDLATASGIKEFAELARTADVVVDARPGGPAPDHETVRRDNPGLVWARITPFGDTGPWSRYVGSDLVHLALGGVAMNCGYDPDEQGRYDTPPVAPQMWQAYQLTGEIAAMSVLGALHHRHRTGVGQLLETSVHQAVAQSTETDLPDWVYLRQPHLRQTARHSMTATVAPWLAETRDGRYLMPYRTYLRGGVEAWQGTADLLDRFGVPHDLRHARYDDPEVRRAPATQARLAQLIDTLVRSQPFDTDMWRDAQRFGLTWAPVRRPEENLHDEHWLTRGAFLEVEHPELGRSVTYTGAKWVCAQVPWTQGPRAPLRGEHTAQVRAECTAGRPDEVAVTPAPRVADATAPDGAVATAPDPGGALRGIRVVDLSWMLASAGAGRFLAAMGAEVIKVEHSSRFDAMRFGQGACPPGGRAERDGADAPLPTPPLSGPDRSGAFLEINSGKLGISLDLKHPEGRRVLEELIADADLVVEGFSPGTMDRMGFGYDRLRELNPRIVYAQQSGFGQAGTYGPTRAYGPTVQAITGITEMSGLPDPLPPAGIGYSFLDWIGAYNLANALLAALVRRDRTGAGCHIDASQGEAGLQLTGTAVLDATVNGRHWARYGNRSPWKPAAPHGIYRVSGTDRWIAVAAFDDPQWRALAEELGAPEWITDPRFGTLAERCERQDDLDALVSGRCASRDGAELMARLQARGVPAGICQSAEDRCDADPQLRHLDWQVELDQREIGRWPVRQFPTRMSATPADSGGPSHRSGPNYGQDTADVLRRVLGRTDEQIARLRTAGAV